MLSFSMCQLGPDGELQTLCTVWIMLERADPRHLMQVAATTW